MGKGPATTEFFERRERAGWRDAMQWFEDVELSIPQNDSTESR
jgi:hypothetical protein